jgi:hypothetical protein
MSKARDFADIAGAVSAGKIASTDVNVSFENITDTGTEGTKIATGTTAQRGSTSGEIRYNSTLSRFEATSDGSQFVGFATPPTITSISPTTLNSAGGETVVIIGTNFVVGGTTVTFDGTAPSSTTVNSSTQITVSGTPAKSAATYTNGLVVNASGATATFTFTTSGVPAFTTSAGSLGSFNEGTSVGTLDAGTDVGTSHSVTTGSLPSGLSINSSSGDITGTLPANTNTNTIPENATGDVTTTFTVTATDAQSQSSTRQFSIVNKQGDPQFSNTYYCFSNTTSPTTNQASNTGTITNNNSTVITSQTSTKKFGTNALRWNGDGSDAMLDIAVPSSQAFNESGSNYMCYDGWGYLEQNRGNVTWGNTSAYGNQGFIGVGDTYMSVSIDSTGRVGFYQYDGSPQYRGQWPTTGNISTGSWFHFIFQFEDNQVRYWKDGTYIGTIARGSTHSSAPHSYRIGGTLGGSSHSGRHWKGYFDELRLTITGSSSEARISGSSSYTVPTESLRLFTT